jgi:Tol biopolymer transport system component
MEPAMSPDGTFMIFVSNRPIQKGGKELDGFFNGHAQPGQGGNLWRVERSGDVWGEPTHISERVNRGNTVFAPSVAANGTLYFMTPDEHSGKFRLHSSQYSNETYQSAEPLLFSDGMSSDVDPAVAPDESFIVFGSGRAPAQDMDLFIAFRENNRWGTPVHMGTKINSPGSDAEARLSPDHSTLYFSSERTTPIRFPRTREQAERDLHRIQLWDNGEYNIWHVSLVPWLEEHLKSQKPSTEHTPQPNSD